MDIVNFDALKAQGKIIDPSQVDPNEDYFIIGKYTKHYTTNSYKYTDYPVYAIKAGDVMGGGYTPPYKVYTALLTQTGTSDPVATVLENTLSGLITWTRSAIGDYYGTLTGEFTLDKVWVIISKPVNDPYHDAIAYRDNLNRIGVVTRNNFNYSDDILYETSIEIRVYN